MVVLLAVGFLAGIVTGLSPCVLPVVPVFAAGGAMGGGRWRPVGIVAGMVLTFSAVTLAGSSLLSFLGLPQDLLRDLGIAVLFVLGASLVVPAVGYLVERPFARLTPHRAPGARNGLLLGASLGLVFVPCAGPVLAAITVVGATHRVGGEAVAVTLFYAAGAAIPLLVIAYLSRRAAARARSLRRRAPRVRQVAGVLIVASAALVLFGAAQPLQKDLPGYASALDTRIEGSASIASRLRALSGEHALRPVAAPAVKGAGKQVAAPTAAPARTGRTAPPGTAAVAASTSLGFGTDLPDASNKTLTDYGTAPRLLKIAAWLNTPGGRPLSLASLKGKVVLVDFWTYSCINCQRSLPHLEAWYREYRQYGLVIIGVHTPEFAFERVIGNVRRAARSLGVDYPIAIDNSYLTWENYGAQEWPTEYLIDQTGQLRYIEAGEGNYGQTGALIRDLLSAYGRRLPPPTDVPDLTPKETTTPETYLGIFGLQLYAGTHLVLGATENCVFAPVLPLNYVSFQGVWTNNGNYALSRSRAALRLHFQAKDVYLVLGGSGTVTEVLGGHVMGSFKVGGYPRLYTIVKGTRATTNLLQLDMTAGISAYDFTFG
ncbi:MAG: cytochrome c biogenesis protein CcdA [Acidimicrobiales bacterium]